MPEPDNTRIVILGGGFGGLFVALELEKTLARDPNVNIVIVNRENFFLFTPMLHEVAASDLDLTSIVNPARKLLRRVNFLEGDVERIDLQKKTVQVSHGVDHHHHEMPYGHLVIALGSITNFYGLPGLAERALTMKSLGDAIHLRNRLIAHLEHADPECGAALREPLLTFVVAGGGFAGVETIAGINDFVRDALPFYPNLKESDLRVVLVHPGPTILPELGEKLGTYAQKKLAERGVDIRVNVKVTGVSDDSITLSDGTFLRSRMVIWTAGTSANPQLASLPCHLDHGRICVDSTLAVPGWPNVWALGDCALIPDERSGKFFPPTAQHALRQARVVAHNIGATERGGTRRKFSFATIGQLAAIGRRSGVANILGFNFSGFVAWLLWRSIYLSKLPRMEKKVRVALDWTLDLIFSKDLVQYQTFRAPSVSEEEMTQDDEPREDTAA